MIDSKMLMTVFKGSSAEQLIKYAKGFDTLILPNDKVKDSEKLIDMIADGLYDIDGVMYSKDKTKLLLYPRGRNPSSISFPATVKEIDSCAFYKCNDLTNVVLPEKMVRVYGYEFLQCENLRDITFPKGIKQIYGIGYQIGGGPGAGGWIIGDIDNVVIRGYTNSPAETYAQENGFTFISLGTINKLGDSNSDNNYKADTRLGVEVEYIPAKSA